MMGGHEEREQTLNALLVQMDGFEPTKGIILLGATNRPGMLDPALLRAGRFDRQISVPRPDLKGREEILEVHSREIKLADEVDLHKVAALTPGFVGADLANLVNEAALLAARRGEDAVGTRELQDSIERVVAGLERRNRLMNPEEKKIVAHHESGHALVACLVPGADPVRKVSMVARGAAGLGFTMQMPQEDRYLMRKRELIDRLAVMLAGRSAEEVIFEEVSTGASDDLAKATDMARKMVLDYGMSDQLGPLSYPRHRGDQEEQQAFLGKPWSEKTNREIDQAVKELVCTAHDRARNLLGENRDALEAIAHALMEKEVLEQDELRKVLEPFGIEIQRHRAVTEEEPEEEEERENPNEE
jgi:cell division protease FtsH